MAAPVLRPLSIGEVLDVSFGLYRSLFFPLVTVAAVCRTLPLLMSLYIMPTNPDPVAAMAVMGDRAVWLLALVLFTMLTNAFAVAATTSIVAKAYLGGFLSAGDALARAAGLLIPVIVVSLLTGLAVMAGMIVLIVPGIILFCGLVLSTATLVLEPGTGPTAAMGRSWNLTSGYRWKIFATLFVALLFLLIPSMIVGVVAGIGGMIGAWPVLLSSVLTGVLQIAVYPFLYVVITVLYYDLRVRKEGLDLELLATATHVPA